MLLIRERAPLRLSTLVTTPSGRRFRWGADDPNPKNAPQGLTFSTVMPGGFEQMSCTLERDPARQYPDLEELSKVTVSGPGGGVAFEGRLEQQPDTGGNQAQVSPQIMGYQSHLDDDSSAAMIYVDQGQSTWQDPSVARQIALLTASQQLASGSVGSTPVSSANPSNTKPAIIQTFSDSWASPFTPVAESWYDSAAAGPIALVYYNLQGSISGGTWANYVYVTNDPVLGSFYRTGNLNAISSGYFTPTGPLRFAMLQYSNSDSPAGQQGATYNSYWTVAVYGNHGLTGYGSDPVGFLASDVIAHAVGKWCPLLSITNDSVQRSQFVIPQLVFPNAGTTSVIIKQAAQYELLDWAVWEGPTFYCNDRRARGNSWRARVGPTLLQDTGPNISRIWNGVIVQYTDVTGITQTVGPPGSNANTIDSSLLDTDPENPANQVVVNGTPLRRWTQVSMGTTTSSAAIKVGAVFLQEQKIVDTSGQATLTGHVEDTNGVLWPAWKVRAGDTVSFVDARDPSPRRVVHTSYDDDSKANSIQLDQPPDGLTALLERLSIVLAPTGLS